MKAPILSCAIIGTLAVCVLNTLNADSATWNTNPVDNNWNNPANWTPATVPNGPNDVATFGVSSTTGISITASIKVNSIVFSPGASAFTITASGLTISGAGITNDSGITQNFATLGFISFTGSASAGSETLWTSNAVIGAQGEIDFDDNASADNATVVSNGGLIFFNNHSTAANATIIANGSEQFGFVSMGSANAGNATFIVTGGTFGGFIFFDGTGPNTARFELYDNGTLYIAYGGGNTAIVGSVEGDGQITIGEAEYLVVGTNHLNTVFSGVIRDDSPPILESSSDAPERVVGGSLIKLGSGTLTLSGANQYSGTTTVIGGALNVANQNGSGTGKSLVNVDSGTVGGTGTIGEELNVGKGGSAGAVLKPSIGGIKRSSLRIHRALNLRAHSTYIYTLNTKTAEGDKVIANGVTIDSRAHFNFVTLANKALRPGRVFVAIRNTAATPINGTFANLPDGSTFTAGPNTYQVSYSGGDGNDLTLTVVP